MSPEIACDHRLASQGLADVFIKMRLPFESDEVRLTVDTWND